MAMSCRYTHTISLCTELSEKQVRPWYGIRTYAGQPLLLIPNASNFDDGSCKLSDTAEVVAASGRSCSAMYLDSP